MSQVNRVCDAQYERPAGRERGDRIVRCDLIAGHDGPHEETETENRWPTVGEVKVVPQAAVDAAHDVLHRYEGIDPDQAEEALRAAAPYIAAAALRQAAEELRLDGPVLWVALQGGAYLRRRADQLDGRKTEPDTREGILAAAGVTEADMAGRRAGDWLASQPGPDDWAKKHEAPDA